MNASFLELKKSYLFIEIGKRIREYIAAHPDNKIIRMGIGDVTQPLVPVVVEAMQKAAESNKGAMYAIIGKTVEEIEKLLTGADYSVQGLRAALSGVITDEYFSGLSTDELISALI